MTKTIKLTLFFISLVLNVLLLETKTIQIKSQEILYIHGFIFTLFFALNKIQKIIKANKPPITYYLAVNGLRIIFSILFLSPKIIETDNKDTQYIINFFLVYFLYLFVDIFSQRFYNKK